MAEKMDVEVVRDCFVNALGDDDVITLEHLMVGYEELARLYDMMGTLFAFVSKDMRFRLKALETLRSDKAIAEHYQTAQAVFDYELSKGIKRKTKGGGLSGNRALLEMHFDIEFFISILRKLGAGTDESKMGELGREAFDETLGKNVNFAVRQAARLAMRWLPTRKVFVDSYIKQDTARCLELVGPTTDAMQKLYDVMEAALTAKNIRNN